MDALTQNSTVDSVGGRDNFTVAISAVSPARPRKYRAKPAPPAKGATPETCAEKRLISSSHRITRISFSCETENLIRLH
eukprot:scaffold285382_cov46-Prasinocladus_malaysianus.AAC.2